LGRDTTLWVIEPGDVLQPQVDDGRIPRPRRCFWRIVEANDAVVPREPDHRPVARPLRLHAAIAVAAR